MGRNQHSKDRLFMTATEWKRDYGGKKEGKSSSYRPLPFDACALSLQPFENPVCTKEGVVFDLENILPYIKKHRKNPINGEAMTAKDIIRLNFHRNADGKWHCPVTFKIFTNNTKIAAVKPSGNVYAMEAIETLNIKPKNFADLLSGESFSRKDIIMLQDPSDTVLMSRRDINNFKHLKELRDETAASFSAASASSSSSSRTAQAINSTSLSSSVSDVMAAVEEKLQKRKEAAEKKANAMKLLGLGQCSGSDDDDDDPGGGGGGGVVRFIGYEQERALLRRGVLTEDVLAGYVVTTGHGSASLTSSAFAINTQNKMRPATIEEIREGRVKSLRKLGKKGYAQIQTNLGNLNVELHCDIAPLTCLNFLSLCCMGYYDNLTFHRLLPQFMVQGGCYKGDGTSGHTCFTYRGKHKLNKTSTSTSSSSSSSSSSASSSDRFAFLPDEFDDRLHFTTADQDQDQGQQLRGLLAMANSGPNTNRSQFFITLSDRPKSLVHLELKHTIFGKVVGGSSVLDRIEAVGNKTKTKTSTKTSKPSATSTSTSTTSTTSTTSSKKFKGRDQGQFSDVPASEIAILHVEVFVNPLLESDQIFFDATNRRADEREKKEASKAVAKHKMLGSGSGSGSGKSNAAIGGAAGAAGGGSGGSGGSTGGVLALEDNVTASMATSSAVAMAGSGKTNGQDSSGSGDSGGVGKYLKRKMHTQQQQQQQQQQAVNKNKKPKPSWNFSSW